jgi:hypothetical protein
VQDQVDVRTQLETVFGAPLNDPTVGDQIAADTALVDDIEAILIAADPGLNDADGSARNAANELVVTAESNGIDTSNPTIRTVLTNLAEGTANASAGGIGTGEFGDSLGAVTRAIIVYEYRLTYVDRIISGVGVGLNIKALQAETRSLRLNADDLEDGEDLVDGITDDENSESEMEFDADIGFLYTPVPQVAVGLVSRHLANPKFDFADRADAGKKYVKLDTQSRLGIAVKPIPQVTIAADADLTENSSDILDGYESQQLCVGIEIRPLKFFALRAGAFDNTASSDSDWVYTAGIGLRTPIFGFDIGAAESNDKTEISAGDDEEEIADRYAIAAVLRFGVSF